MAKKKIIRAKDITKETVFSLYQEVLPYLYHQESGSNPSDELYNRLQQLVPHDSYFFILQGPGELSERNIFIEKEIGQYSSISLKAGKHSPSVAAINKVEKEIYQDFIEIGLSKYPGKQHDYYRLTQKDPPALAGFLRFFEKKGNGFFTQDEKKIFKKIGPLIFPLICTIQSFAIQSRSYQYFKTYSEICNSIADTCNLSDAENKIMIELLMGNSTKEIALRNFISQATVKKHLRSIFKKTRTKNKVDFIGKFFTSPERVKV